MPAAARFTDDHKCPMVEGQVKHEGGPVASNATTVHIGGQPAVRMGDTFLCTGVGKQASVSAGEPTVLIEGAEAARQGDPTAHGGKITSGCSSVLIGVAAQEGTSKAASGDGSTFAQKCKAEPGKAPASGEASAVQSPPPQAPSASSVSKGGGPLSKLNELMSTVKGSKEFKAVSQFLEQAQLGVRLAQGVRPFFDGKQFNLDANQSPQEAARTLADEVNRVKRNLVAQKQMASTGPASRQDLEA